jgi:hypothetical protein
MTDEIRFHLDENVDSAIADGLRRRGLDVTMSNDVSLIGLPTRRNWRSAYVTDVSYSLTLTTS